MKNSLGYLLISFLCIVSCHREESYGSDQKYFQDMAMYFEEARYDSIIQMSSEVFDSSQDGSLLKAYSAVNMAQAYLFLEKFDSAKYYLEQVEDYSGMPDNWSLMLNNVAGIYSIKVNCNYTEALEHFKTALDYAIKANDDYNACIFLCNIVNIYTIRKDMDGLEYAEKAYNLAAGMGNEYLKCFSNMAYATMLYMNKQYDKVPSLIDQTMDMARKNRFDFMFSSIYLIIGNLYYDTDKNEKALDAYENSMKWIQFSDPSTFIKLCYSYGNLMLRMNNPEKAAELFEKGLDISGKTNNAEYRNSLLLGLSEVYHSRGDDTRALEYFTRYHEVNDSLFSMKTEMEFNRLLQKYDKAVYEKELEKREQSRYRILFATILISLLCVFLYVLYSRKNLMYRKLVEQYKQVIQLKDNIRENRNAVSPVYREMDSNPDEKDDIHTVSEEKKDYELFKKIENLLVEEKFYRKNDISLEMLCEMLESNRLYVSRAINRYAGMPFWGYVNSLRIDEATRLLSDPDNDIPLKQLCSELGYNSLSVFYRVFQKETGCPPSKFREQIKRISKDS